MNQPSIADKLIDILEIARLAPSVHNTQPWKVAANGNTITVQIDKTHMLKDGDPTGRQTIISLGIFCEAITIAAAQFGFSLETAKPSATGAELVFKSGKAAASSDNAVKLLQKRSSDRSIYAPAEVSAATVKDLEAISDKSVATTVTVVTDQTTITTIADLTSHGIALALSSPGFRRELSQYLTLPWSAKHRGISVNSLYIPRWLAYLQPLLVRSGISTGAEAKLEKQRWESASAVVLILADGDMLRYWFSVGQCYLRVSLAIEAAGLSQATSAAIVEASNYHEDIEELLGTDQRILALIRIGRGSTKRQPSPRLSASELTST